MSGKATESSRKTRSLGGTDPKKVEDELKDYILLKFESTQGLALAVVHSNKEQFRCL